MLTPDRRCSIKEMFLKIWRNSLETCLIKSLQAPPFRFPHIQCVKLYTVL